MRRITTLQTLIWSKKVFEYPERRAILVYSLVTSMAMSTQQISVHARASPVSVMRRPRPSNMGNWQGLSGQGRGRPKKLVHKKSHNDDGCHILHCSEAHDLANTFFKKRPSHLTTYSSGERSTQKCTTGC